MRTGKLIITIDHTHDHAPHYGKHALKTSIIAVTVASALTLTVFASGSYYNSHGTLKYDQNLDGTDEIELNGAEIQNLGAAALNQKANLANANDVLTTIQAKNTELANSTTDLSDKVEGLANTVQASLAKNGVCMNTDGGSSKNGNNYKQALASALSDYNSTADSGKKANSSNLNLLESINCINNIGKLPADRSNNNVVGITALSDNDLKDFTTAHSYVPTAEQKAEGNKKGINYTSQLMAGSGAWMADDGGLKWYEGTMVNRGSLSENASALTGFYTGTDNVEDTALYKIGEDGAASTIGTLLGFNTDGLDAAKIYSKIGTAPSGTSVATADNIASDFSAISLNNGWVTGNNSDYETEYEKGKQAGQTIVLNQKMTWSGSAGYACTNPNTGVVYTGADLLLTSEDGTKVLQASVKAYTADWATGNNAVYSYDASINGVRQIYHANTTNATQGSAFDVSYTLPLVVSTSTSIEEITNPTIKSNYVLPESTSTDNSNVNSAINKILAQPDDTSLAIADSISDGYSALVPGYGWITGNGKYMQNAYEKGKSDGTNYITEHNYTVTLRYLHTSSGYGCIATIYDSNNNIISTASNYSNNPTGVFTFNTSET